jgi:ADP-heptose:LPS heptosyltransferase
VQSRGISVSRGPTAPAPSGVVIHPGSGSPRKNWPADRYLELVSRLRADGVPVRVLTGEVEAERWPADLLARFGDAAPVARPQTHLELLGELLSARAFVGNDSGPGHLAAILGVPTLTLFGPTDPARWKPLGPRVEALRAEPLDALELDRVHDALRLLLPK